MTSLDKNFFDEIKSSCPKAFDLFLKWIDEYKARVGWSDIFPNGVKFHDLPIEMQTGILERFDDEQFMNKNSVNRIVENDIKGIKYSFSFIENELNKKQNTNVGI